MKELSVHVLLKLQRMREQQQERRSTETNAQRQDRLQHMREQQQERCSAHIFNGAVGFHS